MKSIKHLGLACLITSASMIPAAFAAQYTAQEKANMQLVLDYYHDIDNPTGPDSIAKADAKYRSPSGYLQHSSTVLLMQQRSGGASGPALPASGTPGPGSALPGPPPAQSPAQSPTQAPTQAPASAGSPPANAVTAGMMGNLPPGIADLFQSLRQPDGTMAPMPPSQLLTITADGDKVVYCTYREFKDAKTGKMRQSFHFNVFRVGPDGKLVEHWAGIDTPPAM